MDVAPITVAGASPQTHGLVRQCVRDPAKPLPLLAQPAVATSSLASNRQSQWGRDTSLESCTLCGGLQGSEQGQQLFCGGWFLTSVARRTFPQARRFQAGQHVRERWRAFPGVPRVSPAVRLDVEVPMFGEPEDHQRVHVQRRRRGSLHRLGRSVLRVLKSQELLGVAACPRFMCQAVMRVEPWLPGSRPASPGAFRRGFEAAGMGQSPHGIAPRPSAEGQAPPGPVMAVTQPSSDLPGPAGSSARPCSESGGRAPWSDRPACRPVRASAGRFLPRGRWQSDDG